MPEPLFVTFAEVDENHMIQPIFDHELFFIPKVGDIIELQDETARMGYKIIRHIWYLKKGDNRIAVDVIVAKLPMKNVTESDYEWKPEKRVNNDGWLEKIKDRLT